MPKGSRDAWARTLGYTLSSICRDPSNFDPWRKVFMLPRCILANPSSGRHMPWREIRKLVASRLRRWQAGDTHALWLEVIAEEEKAARQRKKPKNVSQGSPRRGNARRAKAAVEEGQYRKAIQALCSGGLAPASPEVLEEMLTKHPQAPTPTIPTGPVPPPADISDADVLRALKSFPSGSAPGPSSCRANYLREAILCPSPDRAGHALRALCGVVKLLCAGEGNPEVAPYLCEATLLTIQKKGGGLHPIAVGETLRRLTSKCLSWAVKKGAYRTLTPLHLGVGVKCGCEAIVHSVSRTLEDYNTPPEDCWFLLLDFSNAFNSVSHNQMIKEVRARIPSIAAWMESWYGVQPILLLGDDTILSQSGVQQGDPLGPLGFALTLQPIIERIKEEVPGLKINAWYLDDGTLCGSPSDLLEALKIVEEDGPARGLHLNHSKSHLYIPKDADTSLNTLPSDILTVREGFNLLGAPIGPTSYCEAKMMKRIEKVPKRCPSCKT